MMTGKSSAPVLAVTYWGTTGTISAPLKPTEVTAKLQAALQFLGERQLLGELAQVAGDAQRLGSFLQRHLPLHLRSSYGGNTTCVEVQTPDALFIIDCGSGFRELGIDLQRRWSLPDYQGNRTAQVLFTHSHGDHIFATPFFDPYFNPLNSFTLHGSVTVMKSLDAVFSPAAPLSSMYFPPTFDLIKASINRSTLVGGQTFAIGSTTIKTMALRHPGGCLGFRFDCQGRSFVFCTDHEHAQAPDQQLAAFARNADLFYVDAQYLREEYAGVKGVMDETPTTRSGWGHSSIEDCVSTAVAAMVRQLHLGHREPKRDDFDLARVERYAQLCMAQTLRQAGQDEAACAVSLAVEGSTIRL
jgi:phosphoribosyl 1,2-cyclic phosphodiesterase